MRKFFSFICLLLLVALPMATPAKSASQHSIYKAMLELFASPDEQTSLGAMMLSVHLIQDPSLENYIRQSRSPKDSIVAKTVKNYALSHWEFDGEEERMRFIREFPEDVKGFKDVLAFENEFIPSVSGDMLGRINEFSECYYPKTIREAARGKIVRLRVTKDAAMYAAEILPDSFELCDN